MTISLALSLTTFRSFPSWPLSLSLFLPLHDSLSLSLSSCLSSRFFSSVKSLPSVLFFLYTSITLSLSLSRCIFISLVSFSSVKSLTPLSCSFFTFQSLSPYVFLSRSFYSLNSLPSLSCTFRCTSISLSLSLGMRKIGEMEPLSLRGPSRYQDQRRKLWGSSTPLECFIHILRPRFFSPLFQILLTLSANLSSYSSAGVMNTTYIPPRANPFAGMPPPPPLHGSATSAAATPLTTRHLAFPVVAFLLAGLNPLFREIPASWLL